MNIYKTLLLLVLFCTTLLSEQVEKVSLQLLWKHQFEFAGFYMAKEKGFYKDAGLEIELKEFKFGDNITKLVEDGESTFGVSYPSIILDRSNGANIVLLNAIFQSSPHVLVSLKSSKINSINDFKNKKIMIENDAIKTAPLLSMLYSENIKTKDINIIKPSFNINDLIDGHTDIFSAYISNELYKLDNAGIKYDIWNPKDYGFDFYNNILFTSTKILKNNPDKVKKFQEASIKGWRYAFENIDETIELILKKYNTQKKTKEALLFEAQILMQLAYQDLTPLGDIDKNKIQRIYDIYNLMGLTKNKINLDAFICKPINNKVKLTIKEKEYLRTHKTITVHNEQNSPPYNFNINGKPTGYSIEYMNLLASKLGIEVKYISGYTWSQFLSMIKNEQIDVILNIKNTSKRREFVNFTSKYITAPKHIYTNHKNIKTLDDLNGKIVSVPKDFFIHSYLVKNYPNIKLNIQKNIYDTILAVLDGKADAIVDNSAVVNYLIKRNGLALKYSHTINDTELTANLNIGTPLNQPILRDILQKAMDSITQKEIEKLEQKWLGVKKTKNNLLTKEEKEYLENKKMITMCIDPNWMPYEKFDNGKHIGMTADYFKLFQQDLGINISLVETNSWNQSLEFAKSRKCDILSLAMETPDRKKYLNFTKPYLSIPLVIATKPDVPFVNDISTLKDKKIGIPKGYAFVEILKNKYPMLNIIEVKNIDDGLSKVNKGELFGYIGTLASIGLMFQNKFTGELKIAGKFDERWELGIGVRNDDKVLFSILNKLVNNLDNSSKQKILNKWIAIKYDKSIDYQIVWNILIVVLIIAIFFIYRQYILLQSNNELERQVKLKTKELEELNQNLEKRIEIAIIENSKKDKILFSQSKMAAMGEMIGNIAHQWRQPLSVITASASGIQLKIEHDIFSKEEAINDLDALIVSSQYLSHTIDDFQNFLKPVKKDSIFNIKDIIDKNLAMFGKVFTNNSIDFILNMEDINITGNQNELLQVIINILNNAKDILKAKKIDHKYIFIDLYKENNKAILSIKDNAGGIPSDIISKIFDAYFTTKHQSQGTGLGLYMSYQIIVNSFDSELTVVNKKYTYNDVEYIGAEFKIVFKKEI